jgi:hypothetical protein
LPKLQCSRLNAVVYISSIMALAGSYRLIIKY